MPLALGESNRMDRAHANNPDAVPHALVTMVIRLCCLKINFFGFKLFGLPSALISMVEFNESSKRDMVACGGRAALVLIINVECTVSRMLRQKTVLQRNSNLQQFISLINENGLNK